MHDSNPAKLYRLIDLISGVYSQLREIERKGGTSSELRSKLGRAYDLIFYFDIEFKLVAISHPDYRYFELPLKEVLLNAQDVLYKYIEFDNNDDFELKNAVHDVNENLNNLLYRLNGLRSIK